MKHPGSRVGGRPRRAGAENVRSGTVSPGHRPGYPRRGTPPCGNPKAGANNRPTRLQLCLRALLVLALLPYCRLEAKDTASPSRNRGAPGSRARSTQAGSRPEETQDQPDRRLAALQREAERLQKRILEVAQQLLSDFPGSEEPLALMGIVCHGLGKDTLALEYWNKALAINPRQGDVLYNMGLVAMQQEDYDKAISYWQKALEINPRMRGPNLAMGRALLTQGKHKQAIAAFTKELTLAPNSTACHYLLGQAHAQLEDYGQAKAHYLKVVKSEPNHSDVYYGLFQVCARLGEKDQAAAYVKRFRQLKSQTEYRGRDLDTSAELARARLSATRLYLGVSELYIGSGKHNKAENVLIEALQVDPNHVDCLKKLTSVYQLTGRPTAALQTARRVTVLEPKDPRGFLVMGTLALQLKQFDQAASALRRAVELAPQASVGYRELARLYLMANLSIEQARAYAQKAVALQQTAENYYILCLTCIRGGDRAAALLAIQQAMKRAPDRVLYRKMYDRIRSQP